MAPDPLPRLETFQIQGTAGRLEGRLELPDHAGGLPARFLAVFGHPHPQHGGTMQNSVVVHGARALARLGAAVARFNFRGVGRSEGSYDGGAGELADYEAVVQWLRTRWPDVPSLVAAGFSFGSMRALECAATGRATAWLGVAPPLSLHPNQLPPRLTCPAAMVLAGADELVRRQTPAEEAARFADLRGVEVVAGAGHLFIGRLAEVAAAVGRAAERLLVPAVQVPFRIDD